MPPEEDSASSTAAEHHSLIVAPALSVGFTVGPDACRWIYDAADLEALTQTGATVWPVRVFEDGSRGFDLAGLAGDVTVPVAQLVAMAADGERFAVLAGRVSGFVTLATHLLEGSFASVNRDALRTIMDVLLGDAAAATNTGAVPRL